MAAKDANECDVLVIGSGASGMSAAVSAAAHGLKVLIIEKEPKFGGTTARSGGWLWIPGTSLAKAWGIQESPDLARTYLRHEAGNSFDSARVDAFIEHGPKAVDFFITKTSVRFDMPMVFPDYHAEAPGGTQGGRSMVARPFDGRELGTNIKNLGAADGLPPVDWATVIDKLDAGSAPAPDAHNARTTWLTTVNPTPVR